MDAVETVTRQTVDRLLFKGLPVINLGLHFKTLWVCRPFKSLPLLNESKYLINLTTGFKS